MTHQYDWPSFLEQFNSDLLSDGVIRANLPPDVVQSRWLGFPSASERELRELENRLGTRLPESYRQFLATTNGWRASGAFIDQIWPAATVDWFRVRNQSWIDAYTKPNIEGIEPPPDLSEISVEEHCDYGEDQNCARFRTSYLESCLEVSDHGDSAIYLLNPEIRTNDGEWEAWFFANWNPGAHRYRSFWEMLQAELRTTLSLQIPDRNDVEEREQLFQDLLDGFDLRVKEWSRAENEENGKSGTSGPRLPEEYLAGLHEQLRKAHEHLRQLGPADGSERLDHAPIEAFANSLESKWLQGARSGQQHDELTRSNGESEGCRDAMCSIHCFLNRVRPCQPKSATDGIERG